MVTNEHLNKQRDSEIINFYSFLLIFWLQSFTSTGDIFIKHVASLGRRRCFFFQQQSRLNERENEKLNQNKFIMTV